MEPVYLHNEIFHNFRAAEEVLPFVINTFKPSSIIDIGCGIGTWLKVAKDLGVNEIVGIDGDYINRKLLKINDEEFIAQDLRNSFSLKRKFDLAICLEVAEHLPEESASKLIITLCSHSDIIIFSAAIPNQGGQNHINEQWPAYWINLFAQKGFYAYDILRGVFWNNQKVDFWYRQNMIVFSKKNIIELYGIQKNENVYPYIHPELFEKKISEIKSLYHEIEREKTNPGVKNSFQLFIKSLKKKFS